MRQAQVVLQSDKVQLRPWQREDASWYVAARDDVIYQWTTERRTLTVVETEAAIQQVNVSDNTVSFAIIDRERELLVGNIALSLDEKDRTSGEVMYWLVPVGRGRGLATAAVMLICEWGFTELGLTQVTLQTAVGNLRSQRVAERVGFQRMVAAPQGDGGSERIWFVLHNRLGALP